MNIGKKEVVLVWGAIILFLSVLTKLAYNLYLAQIFQYVSRYTGNSLALMLFFIGWAIFIIFVLNALLNWCIYKDNF
ncbi:MAG: hypothetical protein PHU82_01545 [Candidatus Pacebacteria bacterium]|jgi:hypothetical protein|nr:hypothetical protein [Candidatus Paceibacterota bacterium]